MTERRFVLAIDESAFESSVVAIEKKLIELEGKGMIYSSTRTIDAMLQDLSKGVPDSVLLKTQLVQYSLEALLQDELGKDLVETGKECVAFRGKVPYSSAAWSAVNCTVWRICACCATGRKASDLRCS